MLENLDCKRVKEVLKASLKEELLRTESPVFFLKVFDHFAIRDHKKFCKESIRRLNEWKFFARMSIELDGMAPKETLPLMGVVSERGVVKLLALMMQDETRKRGGEKAKGDVIKVIEELVKYYATDILKRPERAMGILEDILLEVNPMEKKYLDKDVVNTLQNEIQQLKKTNQSLNNQIQGLRSKENEHKKRLNTIIKRLEVVEGILKVKPIEEKSTCFQVTATGGHTNSAGTGDKASGHMNNSERAAMPHDNNNPKTVLPGAISKEQQQNSSKDKPRPTNKFQGYLDNVDRNKKQLTKQISEKKEENKESGGGKKPKSPFGMFNNEKDLPNLLDYLKKTQEELKDKQLVFTRVYEGSKQAFQLGKLIEFTREGMLKEGVLLFVKTSLEKVIGAYFSKGLEGNVHKEDPHSFLFMLNPFKIFGLKSEFKSHPVIFLKESGFFIGQDLILANEGDKNHSNVEIPKLYGDTGDDLMIGILAGVKTFLMKEMMILGVRTEG